MNFFGFFKKNKNNELVDISSIFEETFNEFFAEKGFHMTESVTNDAPASIKFLYKKEKLFILIELIKVGSYAMAMNGEKSGKDPYWVIKISVGEGVSEFPELNWSSIDLSLLTKEEGKEYNFSTNAIARSVLGKAKNDIEQYASDFLVGDLTEFKIIRRKRAESKEVFPIIIQKRDEITYEENKEELSFKAKYSKGN